MANSFASVVVPSTVGVAGTAVDVSALGHRKTLVVTGRGSTGVVQLQVSNDGVSFSPVLNLDLTDSPPPYIFTGVSFYMRAVRTSGSGAVSIDVGALSASNTFFTLTVPRGNSDGPVIDASATTGDSISVIVSGGYIGDLVLEGSNDLTGEDFDPVWTFTTKGSSFAFIERVYARYRVSRRGADEVSQPSLTLSICDTTGTGGSPDIQSSYATTDQAQVTADVPVYTLGMLTSNSYPTFKSFTTNTLWACPFVMSKRQKIATLTNLNRSAPAAARNMRWGIYSNILESSTMTPYPYKILYDSGDIVVSATDQYTVTPDLTLEPGLYWLITLFATSFTYMMDSNTSGYMFPILGTNRDLRSGSGLTEAQMGVAWTHSYTYGALPAQFPKTSPVIITADTITNFVPSAYARFAPAT